MFILALSLWLIANFTSTASSYNILGIFPVQAKSHYAFIDPLMIQLAKRGHRVVSYSPFPKNYRITNYTDVSIAECFGTRPTYSSIDSMVKMSTNPFILSLYLLGSFNFSVERFENCAPLVQLLNSTEKYDILVTESFITEFGLVFAAKFGIPVVSFVPNSLASWMAGRVANPSNPSYIPNLLANRLVNTNFYERLENTLLYLQTSIMYRMYNLKNDEKIFESVLGQSPSVPSLHEFMKNTSVILTSAHESLNPVIPTVPGVINVGGIHIKPAAKLTEVGCVNIRISCFSSFKGKNLFAEEGLHKR